MAQALDAARTCSHPLGSGTPRLHLERMTAASSEELRESAREFETAGESAFEWAAANPEAFFQSVETLAIGEDLPPYRVQQDEYWLLDWHQIVGSCRVRHYLVPSTEVAGGHIGYEI